MWESSSSHVEIKIGHKPYFTTKEEEIIPYSKGRSYPLICVAEGQPIPKVYFLSLLTAFSHTAQHKPLRRKEVLAHSTTLTRRVGTRFVCMFFFPFTVRLSCVVYSLSRLLRHSQDEQGGNTLYSQSITTRHIEFSISYWVRVQYSQA